MAYYSGVKCDGYLMYNRVVILDNECSNKMYWNGFYGSFLGVSKPKEKDIKAPLELSLVEALYLVEADKLRVYKGSRELSLKELEEYASMTVPRFSELYKVYKDLRKRGYVLRRGLKFGCDYLAYEHGPGIDHAPYGVQVVSMTSSVDPIDFVRMGRLLHSVRKKLIIAIVDRDVSRYLLLKWWKP
ncbi:MAG: tRNA-intron lyase [Desulfurococcaceae archaeon]